MAYLIYGKSINGTKQIDTANDLKMAELLVEGYQANSNMLVVWWLHSSCDNRGGACEHCRIAPIK